MRPIYLDYNATTPVLPEVAAAMRPFLSGFYGNPSSSHWYGRQARQAIEKARDQVAALLDCAPDEIIFTSGGSEANNYAIKGLAFARQSQGEHIITSQIEHPAVSEVCHFLKRHGFEISVLPVSAEGILDPAEVGKAIRADTILISIMHANNEVGSIQPLEEISSIIAKRDIVFHSDGAQSVGKIATRINDLGVDLFSVAGHKLYGPKGIGVLYIRRGLVLEKQIHGAGHERNLRAGTENILEIAGLGKACELAMQQPDKTQSHLKEMRERLVTGLERELKGQVKFRLNGHPDKRLPNTASISFAGLAADRLLTELADQVAVSAGAACHPGGVDLSATLKAMQVPPDYAMGTLRFSTGKPTTAAEIDRAVKLVSKTVKRLARQ